MMIATTIALMRDGLQQWTRRRSLRQLRGILVVSVLSLLSLPLFRDALTLFFPHNDNNENNENVAHKSHLHKHVTCWEAPRTLAIGVGGRNAQVRAPFLTRLHHLLISLEHVGSQNVHLLLWLEPLDHTTLPLVQGYCQNLGSIASVTVRNVGNVTERTAVLSPPLTNSFTSRAFDFIKFWGIHDATQTHSYIFNVDVDVIFLQPLETIWREACARLAQAPWAFYVGGRETLNADYFHPGFTRYVNTGVGFLNLHQLNATYTLSQLQSTLLPEAASNANLTQVGQWPPEQWLWNAMFETHPDYLTLFHNTTHCNCATHFHLPAKRSNDSFTVGCKLVHYCNTPASESIFHSTIGLTQSLAHYLDQSEPELAAKLKKAT